MKTIKKYWITTFIISISSVAFASDANEVTKKIEDWQYTFLNIVKALIKFGGIVALTGIAIFLYINNDQAGVKKAKQSFIIVLFATFLAWFSDIILKAFGIS